MAKSKALSSNNQEYTYMSLLICRYIYFFVYKKDIEMTTQISKVTFLRGTDLNTLIYQALTKAKEDSEYVLFITNSRDECSKILNKARLIEWFNVQAMTEDELLDLLESSPSANKYEAIKRYSKIIYSGILHTQYPFENIASKINAELVILINKDISIKFTPH